VKKLTFLISSALLLVATPSTASAATCASDWPENIFEGGYSGPAFIGAQKIAGSNFQYSGGKQISIAISPQISSEYENLITGQGKNIKVDRTWSVINALTKSLHLVPEDPNVSSFSAGTSINLLGNKPLSIPGIGPFNGWTSGGKSIAFEISPNVALQTVVTILTPGCTPRTFKSAVVPVPKLEIRNFASSEVQTSLTEIAADFTQVDSFNKYATSLEGQTIPLDSSLNYTLPGLETIKIPVVSIPDWRTCPSIKATDSNFQIIDAPLFSIADNTKSFDCTVPLYGFFKGGVTTIANIHFRYNAIAVASKASVRNESKITCVKGKLKRIVTAVNPKCPSGYKKKT
jgi:hypothetical protein